jgi:thioredoxin reductase
VTLLTSGIFTLDCGQLEELAARNIKLEVATITRIEGTADVRLADGRLVGFVGLFTLPRCTPSTPVAERLGCALEDMPFGVQIKTDAMKETTVPGVFACGDVARVPHSVSLAVGDGAWAGAQVHRSLVL